MPNPRHLTDAEVETLETLITGAEDQSVIKHHVEALADYKNDAATEEQLDLLENLLDLMEAAEVDEYVAGLSDPAVQRAFDEAEVPPLPDPPPLDDDPK